MEEQLLQALADSLLPLFNNMPSVKVRLFQDPYFNTCNALACYRCSENAISIRPSYKSKSTYDGMVGTLKHELCHAWVWWQRDFTEERGGHGHLFLSKALDLGLDLTGTLQSDPTVREEYDSIIECRKLKRRFIYPADYYMVFKLATGEDLRMCPDVDINPGIR